jgi:hypothetical protein
MGSSARTTNRTASTLVPSNSGPPHVPLLIAALAAVLLSVAALGVASVVEWSPAPAASAAPRPAAPAGVRAKGNCPECGFVQSVRRVKARGDAPETYVITVRLRDGSTHVHTEATPANWRRGQRVVFIAGERLPGG